jgi:hypothetical protein
MELRANTEGAVMGGDGKIQASGYGEIDHFMRTAFAEVQNFTEFEILSLYPSILFFNWSWDLRQSGIIPVEDLNGAVY